MRQPSFSRISTATFWLTGLSSASNTRGLAAASRSASECTVTSGAGFSLPPTCNTSLMHCCNCGSRTGLVR